MSQKIEISFSNIFRVALILLVLLIVFLIREVILLFFIAFVAVAALDPLVSWLQEKKIPRILSTLLIFLTGLGLLGLVIYLLVPPLVAQISALASNLPQKLPFDLKMDYLQDVLKAVGNYLVTVPASISSIIVTLIIAFYLLIQEQGIERFFKTLLPRRHQARVLSLLKKIQKKMGHWLLGQMASCLIVGVLSFIGLFFLGVPYALVLALAVGIAEIVPFGPVIAFIPAGILGFLQSPLTGILVIVLYIIIQQIEGNIIMPQIMKKAVGLNPVLVILALLIGAKLAGILGLLVAIPAASALSVFAKDFMNHHQKRKKHV